MAIKKLELIKDSLEKILNDKIDINIPKGKENNVDFEVRQELLKHFNNDKSIIKFNETDISKIDKDIPSTTGKGKGELDVLIFNYITKNNIDLIIEDKKVGSSEDALDQAIMYANGLNRAGNVLCRVVIGHIPAIRVRILVKSEWKPLIINGEIIDYFFGPNILKLIYSNPNHNEFKLDELIEKPFTQKDFHNVINKLKTLYRQIPEIQNNDDLSINFTVSFVALKMVMEKQGIQWDTLKNIGDIETEIKKIVGDLANEVLEEKYLDIFVMKDKDNSETFNFYNTLHIIYVRENSEKINPLESIIMKIHKELAIIPEKDLAIDLFGEVYECLASKKMKSSLGEFFTRRHIIRPLVRMFLTDDDIHRIINDKKTIADIACGTGGFLTESFKHIKKICDTEYTDQNIDTSDLASKVVIGYDINHNNIGRTRINMTLAGDGFSVIERANTLTSTKIKTGLDYIMTNIPYGKGDYAISDPKSKDDFLKTNNNKRLELNFLIKAIELLGARGKASIIVPEGLMEAPTLSPLREYILKQCKITTIISLPKFSFAPYTKWKTYVIFIEKRNKPLDNLENKLLQNERIYTYIVDNDGFANSDKRFPTNLTDKDGRYLHNELSCYIDKSGARHLSKMEEIYETKEEDEVCLYSNEWNEEIKGKKYGWISLKEILDKKTVKHSKVKISKVKNVLWQEYNEHLILSDEDYDTLSKNIVLDKKGKAKKITRDNFIINDELKEEFIPIFEALGFEYDAENNKYYDTKIEEITYALPLVPEKYLRKKEIKEITVDELITNVSNIEKELGELFGGNRNENK